jgi:hypothetical protein
MSHRNKTVSKKLRSFGISLTCFVVTFFSGSAHAIAPIPACAKYDAATKEYAICVERLRQENAVTFIDETTGQQCAPSSNATPTATPGKLFILGDSIGLGVTEPLKGVLPAANGWSVESNTKVGRSLKEGIDIVNASRPEDALLNANTVLIVLGTNNLTSSTNEADIKTMTTALRAKNSGTAIRWLKTNVTRSDLTAGSTQFNELLGKDPLLQTISNSAAISSDGVHPSDYSSLASEIGTSLMGGANQTTVVVQNCACNVGTSIDLNGSDNAEKIWNYFTGVVGLSAIQTAGIMGNMQQESGLDSEIIQGGRRSQNPDDAGSGGWGLIQWTPGSKIRGLLTDAKITGAVHELGTQLQLVRWHMENTSPTGAKNMMANFRNVTTIEEAVKQFEEKVEGAGNPQIAKRVGFATEFHNLYGGNAPSTGGAGAVSTSSGGCSDITRDGENTQFIDGFTVYSQTDPVWKDRPYSTSTIGTSGCGPSAMAMIITALTGQKVTPVETAEYAAEQGMYVKDQGSKWEIGSVLAKKWGLQAKNIGVNQEAIAKTLQAGGLVITAGKGAKPFTSGGHFIVIRGITSDGKFKVGDSGHSDTSDKEWDPQQLLESMKGRDGSVYAITK